MLSLIKKYWFFIGIFFAIIFAFTLPKLGQFVREYNILNIGIFIAFFITGLSLETYGIGSQIKNYKVLVVAMISSLLIFPLLAKVLSSYLLSEEFMIGVCIIATAPVTVASGVVMTAIGRGNVPLALIICVVGNVLAIFTMPISLKLLISHDVAVELPVLKMLFGLLITVLIPVAVGQILRPFLKDKILSMKKFFSIFQQGIVLLIIFNAVASSTDKIVTAGMTIIFLAFFMVLLHLLFLLINFGLSKTIRLDLPSTTAFTIQVSQKTLTVSYVVWAGFFAFLYPLAMIPGILYHLSQMIIDSLVAERFRRIATLS
ncbi:MAG: bile acid:sodium symporter [Thermodesulfovibrionales bacterium]|nr:bile acid:sodium symporter [Thermodesulfovibrionales bacterium]